MALGVAGLLASLRDRRKSFRHRAVPFAGVGDGTRMRSCGAAIGIGSDTVDGNKLVVFNATQKQQKRPSIAPGRFGWS